MDVDDEEILFLISIEYAEPTAPFVAKDAMAATRFGLCLCLHANSTALDDQSCTTCLVGID